MTGKRLIPLDEPRGFIEGIVFVNRKIQSLLKLI